MSEVKTQLGPYQELLPDEVLSPERYAESFQASAEAAVRTIREPAAGTVPKERVAS